MDSLVDSVEGGSVADTLDAVEGLWLESLENGCEIFVFAAHYADQCAGDGLPEATAGRVVPGVERSVRLGGVGTPRVAEFAASAFGARLRMGTLGGKAMIADALDARHRLPRCWGRVQALEARVPWVRYLARRTRELSVQSAGEIDAELAESVDGRIPWSRFCARVEGLVVAADPEAAANRERARREEVFARVGRGSEHGMKGFYLRGPASLVIRIDATVAFLAQALQALGDTADEDHRRVTAMAILANPTQAVELLAAYAAHRARTGQPADDGPVPEDELPLDHDHDADADDDADDAERDADAGDASDAGAADASAEDHDAGDADDERDADDADDAEDAEAADASAEDHDAGDADDVDAEHEVDDCAGSENSADDRDVDSGETGAAQSTGADAGGPLVPRVFRPGELPGWLARACDPDSRWRLNWPRLLPRVHVFVHVAKETLDPDPATAPGDPGGSTSGVVRWEGEGPITREYLREQLAPFHDFTITGVIDLAGQEPVDAYEIPRRHRQAVRLRTPADCFPFAANLDPVDLDHTRAYQHTPEPGQQQPPPDQSRMDNYSPLGRFHHRVKTHGHWQIRQPFDGIYVWRDPYGAYYLVDHTGTRRTSPPPRRPRPRRTRPGARAKPLILAIHYTDTIIEYDVDAA